MPRVLIVGGDTSPLVMWAGVFRVSTSPFGFELANLATGEVAHAVVCVEYGEVIPPEGNWPDAAYRLLEEYAAVFGVGFMEAVEPQLLA